MQLNDAHVFCTEEQVASEAAAALGMIQQAHRALGIKPARYRLSLAGPSAKYVGSEASWKRAAAVLEKALVTAGLPYRAEEGEAAFYGPKIDVQVADSAEREASIATVQVDFYQPGRFNLEFTGPDNNKHRPVMVHRSIIGSLERAVAHLIESHGGAFPPWLAPTQLVVLPVTGVQLPDAEALARRAVELGLRTELVGAGDGSLGARIRANRLVPYQAVIGPAEAATSEVALRLRDGRKLPPIAATEALASICSQVAANSPQLWGPPGSDPGLRR